MTRKQALERMSAPVIAWLIDQGYVLDMCGWFHIRPQFDLRHAYGMGLRSVTPSIEQAREFRAKLGTLDRNRGVLPQTAQFKPNPDGFPEPVVLARVPIVRERL